MDETVAGKQFAVVHPGTLFIIFADAELRLTLTVTARWSGEIVNVYRIW
jgi:hypothetical protein